MCTIRPMMIAVVTTSSVELLVLTTSGRMYAPMWPEDLATQVVDAART